ncbi:MAG: hypothetical protein Q8K93_31475 [Reyranella sp.]|nr:hypothetical protein [Reyranella sp.]
MIAAVAARLALEHLLEGRAGATGPAFHRADRYATELGDLLVTLPLQAREQEGSARLVRQAAQGAQEVAHDQSTLLPRRTRQTASDGIFERNREARPAQA